MSVARKNGVGTPPPSYDATCLHTYYTCNSSAMVFRQRTKSDLRLLEGTCSRKTIIVSIVKPLQVPYRHFQC